MRVQPLPGPISFKTLTRRRNLTHPNAELTIPNPTTPSYGPPYTLILRVNKLTVETMTWQFWHTYVHVNVGNWVPFWYFGRSCTFTQWNIYWWKVNLVIDFAFLLYLNRLICRISKTPTIILSNSKTMWFIKFTLFFHQKKENPC